jgi:hypothetical protein
MQSSKRHLSDGTFHFTWEAMKPFPSKVSAADRYPRKLKNLSMEVNEAIMTDWLV